MTRYHGNHRPSRRSLLKPAGAVGLGAGAVAVGGTTAAAAPHGPAVAHPGLLHAQTDLDRMAAKVKAGAQPYLAGWQRPTANRHAQSDWKANPQATGAAAGAAARVGARAGGIAGGVAGGRRRSSASASPSPSGGSAKDLADTGSDGPLPLTGAGLLALGGGVPLRARAHRKGAHRA